MSTQPIWAKGGNKAKNQVKTGPNLQFRHSQRQTQPISDQEIRREINLTRPAPDTSLTTGERFELRTLEELGLEVPARRTVTLSPQNGGAGKVSSLTQLFLFLSMMGTIAPGSAQPQTGPSGANGNRSQPLHPAENQCSLQTPAQAMFGASGSSGSVTNLLAPLQGVVAAVAASGSVPPSPAAEAIGRKPSSESQAKIADPVSPLELNASGSLDLQELQKELNIHLTPAQIQELRKIDPQLKSYKIKEFLKTFPQFSSIEVLGKRGINDAFKAKDLLGKEFFVKVFTPEESRVMNGQSSFLKEFPSIHEGKSSQFASHLSGGLVPAGETTVGSTGIVYPWTEIDSKATQSLFESRYPTFKYEDIYPKLNDKQRGQFFVHMMSDLLLDNDDTHSNQFAIDREGNFRGFDKGRAGLLHVFDAKELMPFKTNFELLEKSKVYRDFLARLKKDPDQLKRLLLNSEVQEFFHRVDTLTDEEIKEHMDPLFRFMDHKLKQSGRASHSSSELQKSYMDRFKSLRNSIAKYFSLPEQEVEALVKGFQDPKVALNYQHDTAHGISAHVLEFDPKKNYPKILTAAEAGQPEGETVRSLVKHSGALAGTNGGFFNFGEDMASIKGQALRVARYLGQNSLYRAMPMAILKTEDHLISDSSTPTAVLGWSEDGSKALIGEVYIEWDLHGSHLPSEGLKFTRVTTLHHNHPVQYLYLPSTSDQLHQKKNGLRVKIKNGVIETIENVADQIDETLSNSFVLNEKYPVRDISWLSSLKPGQPFKLKHRFVSDTPGWDQVSQVVSGAQVIVKDGVLKTHYTRVGEPEAKAFRTGVCILKDGRWQVMVADGVGASILELGRYFKQRGCQDAIAMDGGASSTLFVNDPIHPEQHISQDRKVADVLAIMPAIRGTPGATIVKSPIFAAIRSGNLQELESQIQKNPQVFSLKSASGGSVLHEAIEHHNIEAAELILRLVSKNKFNTKNYYGETPLHLALKHGYSKFCKILINGSSKNELAIKDLRGHSYLALAAMSRDWNSVETLFKKMDLSTWDDFKSVTSQDVRHEVFSHSESKDFLKSFIPELRRVWGLPSSLFPDPIIMELILSDRDPLFFAVQTKNSEMFHHLKNRISLVDLRTKDAFGDTLLNVAIKNNNEEFIRHVLPMLGTLPYSELRSLFPSKLGLESDSRVGSVSSTLISFFSQKIEEQYGVMDAKGELPQLVIEAINSGDYTLYKILSDKISYQQLQSKYDDLRLYGSPLFVAIEADSTQIAQDLLKKITPNEMNRQWHINAFHLAVAKGNLQLVKAFLANLAYKNVILNLETVPLGDPLPNVQNEIIELLLDAYSPQQILAKGRNGFSQFKWQLNKKNTHLARKILSKIDANALLVQREGRDSETWLQLVMERGAYDILPDIFDKLASTDSTIKRDYILSGFYSGRTVLDQTLKRLSWFDKMSPEKIRALDLILSHLSTADRVAFYSRYHSGKLSLIGVVVVCAGLYKLFNRKLTPEGLIKELQELDQILDQVHARVTPQTKSDQEESNQDTAWIKQELRRLYGQLKKTNPVLVPEVDRIVQKHRLLDAFPL